MAALLKKIIALVQKQTMYYTAFYKITAISIRRHDGK
jgi:hypothetical protein